MAVVLATIYGCSKTTSERRTYLGDSRRPTHGFDVLWDQEAGDFWGDFPVIFHRLKLLFPEICT